MSYAPAAGMFIVNVTLSFGGRWHPGWSGSIREIRHTKARNVGPELTACKLVDL